MNAKTKILKYYDRKDSGKVSTKTHSAVFYSFQCTKFSLPLLNLFLNILLFLMLL